MKEEGKKKKKPRNCTQWKKKKKPPSVKGKRKKKEDEETARTEPSGWVWQWDQVCDVIYGNVIENRVMETENT